MRVHFGKIVVMEALLNLNVGGRWTVANLKSAIKRAQTNEKKRSRNQPFRSKVRTKIKNVRSLIEAGELEKATTSFHKATSIIDRAVQKGLIHRNHGNRQKSRLAKRLHKLKNQESNA